MSVPHAAVVLAAGGSTRLGRPKQLLTRDGETLVHRAARLAREAGASRVLVVVGAHADEMRNALADLSVEYVVNNAWQTGMAGSLRLAAEALATHEAATLLLACDQPALALSHLQALRKAALRTLAGTAATRFGDRLGIPALVSPDILHRALALHDGDRGLRDVLNVDGLDVVPCDAPELAYDIDTWEDIDAAIAKGWLDPVSS
ncbi:MAG: nucleotidyltransferase family protein [Pseudoxanthomonas mexicana]|nr:nucleotidyltransferase family protein [Pseudoxanthomonas mexicana]